MSLIQILHDEALDIGYTRFGTLKTEKLEGLGTIIKGFPWIKSIIICAFHYNIYKLPEEKVSHLNFYEAFKSRFIENTLEHETAHDFESFLESKGIQFIHGMTLDLKTIEKLAVEMKIGRYRKNMHFYTEEGSHVYLHVWFTDLEMEFINDDLPPPCPDHCSRCIRNCPVQALEKGYEKNENLCINHELEIIHDQLKNKEVNFKLPFIKGCQLCLEICPYNDDRWEETIMYQENYNWLKK
ncbi:MAG: hypothetical protein JXR88_07640 [Clostridia bacterium]|nr:hypothetical protein [Clostridia bacterium]